MLGLHKGAVAVCMNCDHENCTACEKYELYIEKLRDNFREEKSED